MLCVSSYDVYAGAQSTKSDGKSKEGTPIISDIGQVLGWLDHQLEVAIAASNNDVSSYDVSEEPVRSDAVALDHEGESRQTKLMDRIHPLRLTMPPRLSHLSHVVHAVSSPIEEHSELLLQIDTQAVQVTEPRSVERKIAKPHTAPDKMAPTEKTEPKGKTLPDTVQFAQKDKGKIADLVQSASVPE